MNMPRTASALLAFVAGLVPAVLPQTADACWDGMAISTPKVMLGIESTASWSPEQARHWAKWISRIDALVPAGKSLTVMHGFVEICDEAGGECEAVDATWEDGTAFTLFQLTAKLFDTPRATITAARHTMRSPLTVQVAATHDVEAAEKLAARINERELDLAGFMDVGGFPSFNATAHVVESTSGETFSYQVVVGAFLDRSEAQDALRMLETELDLHGFVRPLDQWSVAAGGC